MYVQLQGSLTNANEQKFDISPFFIHNVKEPSRQKFKVKLSFFTFQSAILTQYPSLEIQIPEFSQLMGSAFTSSSAGLRTDGTIYCLSYDTSGSRFSTQDVGSDGVIGYFTSANITVRLYDSFANTYPALTNNYLLRLQIDPVEDEE